MTPEESAYRVVYTESARSMIQAGVHQLLKAGWKKDQIKALLVALENRLKGDPDSFGEPIYTVRAVKIRVAVGFVRPFSVHIGLQEETRSVFVRRVAVMTTKMD